MTKAKRLTVAILGAGNRGVNFGQIIHDLDPLASVVAVAEPRPEYRESFARQHNLPPDRVFEGWQQFAAQPKLCDAVVISTLDRDHVGPAVACLEKGYHLLLEKPMAASLADCRAIEAAQRKAGTIVAVCHSLRHQKGFSTVHEILRSGRLGRLVTLDQLEQVGYGHQAHSFVRGNWGNEGRAIFMLMAKSCHDIDYIAHLAGTPCLRVSSFGALTYFRSENAPRGSTARCTDGCAVEATCPYSALRTYVQAPNLATWPADVCCPVHTREAHLEAIRTGPYGRCVYHCDNDVVDHQVVLMEFEGSVTATFTMTAFTQGGGRRLRLHGTEGELFYDEETITVKTFADNNVDTIRLGAEPGGHGGGDTRVVRNWIEAMRRNDPTLIMTGAQESLRTHTIVFAAEKARREQRTVTLTEM
jgi:predicted dehydrogenase